VTMEMSVNMRTLADLLSLDKQVVDFTGESGTFEVSLSLPSSTAKAVMRNAIGIGMFPGLTDPPHMPILAEAIRKTGLKLEPRRLPLDMIVVDHLEKKPTEN
jgi:uncharacterized protein (TIGR03435 family)